MLMMASENVTMVAELRHKIHGLNIWHDSTLERFLNKNDGDLHGAIAECMEYLARYPDEARKWCENDNSNVKLTHYDLMQMAKHHREKQTAAFASMVAKVAGNWIDQAGVRLKDKSLIKLGEGLMLAEPERARQLKVALSDEWEQWDGEFDEYGRPLPGEGE